ncbi:site-specific integrase [Streptomyces sp. NPDC054956]
MATLAWYDHRWHLNRPKPGMVPCNCGTARNPLYPSSEHGVEMKKPHRIRFRHEGRIVPRCFATKGEADAFKSEIEHKLRSGTYLRPEAKGTTLEQYGTAWLDRNGNLATLAAYERHLRLYVYPILGDRVVASLTVKHIRDFVKCLDASSAYAESIFSTLSTLLTAAVDDGLLAANPCKAESVVAVKPRRRRSSPVSRRVHVWADEITSGVIRGLPSRFRGTGLLGVGAALRPGELVGFSPDDVDFVNGWVDIRRQVQEVKGHGWCFKLPKYEKVRRAPLSGGLAEVLRLHMQEFPPVEVALPWYDPDAKPNKQFRPRVVRLMFTNERMQVIHLKRFRERPWKAACVQAGVMPDSPGPGGTPYAASLENGIKMLRHICATRWIEAGESPVDVADWLGHENPEITFERYVHGRIAAGDRGSTAVDAFLSATLRVPTPRNGKGSDQHVLRV